MCALWSGDKMSICPICSVSTIVISARLILFLICLKTTLHSFKIIANSVLGDHCQKCLVRPCSIVIKVELL